MSEAPELTPKDRAVAINIKSANMYVFDLKHPITQEVHSREQFMVIKADNGRKYVFREEVDLTPKSKIVMPKGGGLIT